MSAAAVKRAIGDVRVSELIAALVNEGLVERAGNSVRLPA